MDSGMNAAEAVLLADRNNNDGYGWGGGMGFFWIFALLLLPAMGGGNFFGNNRGNCVTEADLCNANSFNELKSSVGRLDDQVNGVNVNLGNAICNLGYETLRNFNNLENILRSCCCNIENKIAETQRQIDGVNYNVSQQAANTNTVIRDGIQKVLDTMCSYRQADQQNEINQLRLEKMFCGVVRYPNAMTYNAGYSPFYNSYGCGNNCGRCA